MMGKRDVAAPPLTLPPAATSLVPAFWAMQGYLNSARFISVVKWRSQDARMEGVI